jgi:hypothetical protein
MSVDQLRPIPAWTRSGLPAIIVDVGRVGDVSVVRVAGAVDMTTISLVKVELMRAVMGDTTQWRSPASCTCSTCCPRSAAPWPAAANRK